MLGIKAEDFEKEQISDDDAQYTGRTEAYIPEDKVKEFKKKGILLTEVIRVMKTEIIVYQNFMRMNLLF